jgi:Protein of unknown function (DUF3995)
MAGCMPLALYRAVGAPRRLLRAAVWIVGGAFALYGLASFLDHAAMALGLRATPEALGATAARWHLLFWDPFWMLGGALFLIAARSDAGRRRGDPPLAAERTAGWNDTREST